MAADLLRIGPMKSPITTHILDTSLGRPAAGVAVRLEQRVADAAKLIAEGVTNEDGRIADWMGEQTLSEGVYRITFEIDAYFAKHGTESFYPSASIDFRVRNTSEHYHVPLLLNPFGYSTYRGS